MRSTQNRPVVLSLLLVLLASASSTMARPVPPTSDRQEATIYQVGVAAIDITPDYPIRLSGFGFRREETKEVTMRIWAKALAIDDGHRPVLVITTDNLGIPAPMVAEVAI